MKIAEPLSSSSLSIKKLEPVSKHRAAATRRRKMSIVRKLEVKLEVFHTWSMPEQPAGYMPVKKKDLL